MSDSPGSLTTFCSRFGEGWNRFWFAPSDPLPLAVVRIGVAAILLYVTATFSFDLKRLFDREYGLLPLETVVEVRDQAVRDVRDVPVRFSIFDYAEDATALQGMHYASVAVIVAFMFGIYSRVTSILSYVVFLSYFHRGPMLTGVLEPVMAFLLLYLCLGPCGAELSFDAWRRRKAGGPQVAPPTYGATVSLRLIQVHTALVYFLMFCGKQQGGGVWWNGSAVWWLAARPESALVDLTWLSAYPYLMNFWTTAIFLFEPAFAILVWNRTARPLLLALSIPMWFGIALLTGMVPFALAMLVANASFVAPETWRRMCGRSSVAH